MSEHEIVNHQVNGQAIQFSDDEHEPTHRPAFETEVWGDSLSEEDLAAVKTDPMLLFSNVATSERRLTPEIEAVLNDLFDERDRSSTSKVSQPKRWMTRLIAAIGQVDSGECFEKIAEVIATVDQPSRYLTKFQSFLDRNAIDLDEARALGAAIALFHRHPESSAIPILAGLTVRTVLAPRLEHTQQVLKPTELGPMVTRAQPAVERLIERDQLASLARLSARLGQVVLKRQLPKSAVSELLDQAVNRLLSQETLRENRAGSVTHEAVASAPTASASVAVSAIDGSGQPLTLNLSGPVEIVIRITK